MTLISPNVPYYMPFKELIKNEELKYIRDLFQTNGYEIRIAGGAVRDLVLGANPNDIDLATTATPTQMIDFLSKYEDKVRLITTPTGIKHGTVMTRINDISTYEITTLRIDAVTDGRRAEVEFVNDWKLDASRRDLTINALFLGFDGTLYDYFEGAKDLSEGKIRFVGDPENRIQEDYLRILRYFRFHARYGRTSQHDPATLQAIRDHSAGLAKVSGERIMCELKRILPLRTSVEEISTMINECGIGKYIGLFINDDQKRDLTELKAAASRLRQTDESFGEEPPYQPITLLAALITNENELINVGFRLRLSNLEKDTALYILVNRAEGHKLEMRHIKYQIAMKAKPGQTPIKKIAIEFLKYFGRYDDATELSTWQVPSFPLRGEEVIKKLHGKNKRLIGRVIDEMKLIWAKSDYDMTQAELIDGIDEVIDKIMAKDSNDNSKKVENVT